MSESPHSKNLKRTDSLKPQKPRDFPKIGDREVPHANILSSRDLYLLGRAFEALEPRGDGNSGIAGPVMAAIEDLAALDRTSLAALTGSADAIEIRTMVREFAPWPDTLLSNRPGVKNMEPVLMLRSPGAPLIAAYLAGEVTGRGDTESNDLASRAMTAFLWRAEPVARVALAARGLAEGTIGLEQFEAIATFASNVLRAPLAPEELVKALRDGLTVLPSLWPIVGPAGPLFPRKPPFSAWLLPENQAWAHCATGIRELFKPLPDVPKQSPPPGTVSPSTVCAGSIPAAGLEITISGSGFGAQGLWGISVNSVTAAILSWTNTEIRVRTSTYRPGCNQLQWTYQLNWSFDDQGVGAACGQALRIPPIDISVGSSRIITARTRLWTQPGAFSVLAPRIARFEASAGTNGSKAEACATVVIDWVVDQLPCAGFRQLVSVRLLRDGVVIPRTFSLTDSFPDATEMSATYTLEVTSVDSTGTICGTVTRTILVERLAKAVHLRIPPELSSGTPGEGILTLSCPAPASGVLVTLVSNPANRLVHPPTVTVAPATTEARFQIAVGTECGVATLSASASNHSSESASTCVILPPVITAFRPPTGLKACVVNTLTLTASCVTAPPSLRATAIDSAGARATLRVSIPGGAASCGRSATISLALPPLAPGDYRIEISDRGGTALTTSTFTLDPNPRVLASPLSRTFNVFNPTCPLPASTIQVQVSGADSVAFVYTSPDGDVQQSATAPAGTPCATWPASFTHAFDRVGTVTVAPRIGTTDGPSKSIPVTMNRASNVFSAIEFFGSDPTGMNRAASLTRKEQDPVTTTFAESPAGSVTQGNTVTIAINRCVFTTFVIRRPEVPDPASSSGGKIPAQEFETPVVIGHPDAPVTQMSV